MSPNTLRLSLRCSRWCSISDDVLPIAARIDARIAAVRLAYATGRDGAEPR